MAGTGDKTQPKRSARLFDGPGDDPFAGLPGVSVAETARPPAEEPRSPEPRAPEVSAPEPRRSGLRGVTAPARESSGGLSALRRGARPQDPAAPSLGRRGPPTSQRSSPFKASSLPAPDDLTSESDEIAEPPRRLASLPPPPAVLTRARREPQPRRSSSVPTIVETSGFSLLSEEAPDDSDSENMMSALNQAADTPSAEYRHVRELPEDGATEEIDYEASSLGLERPAASSPGAESSGPVPIRLSVPNPPPMTPSPLAAVVEPEVAPAVSPLLARARAASIRTDSRPAPSMPPTTMASGTLDPAGPSFSLEPPATNPLAQRLAQAGGPTPLAMPRQSLIPRSGTDPGTGPGLGGLRHPTDPSGRRTPHPSSDPGLHVGAAQSPQLSRPHLPQAPMLQAQAQPQTPGKSQADVERSLRGRDNRRKIALLGTLLAVLAGALAVYGPRVTDLAPELLAAFPSAASVAPQPVEPPPPDAPPAVEAPVAPAMVDNTPAPRVTKAPPPEPPAPPPVAPVEAQPPAPASAAAPPVELGVLVVRATPKGKVFIDSRPYGYTPIEKELEARVYTVRVIVPGHGTEERTVRVDPGRAAEVNVSFR